jgi:hypothetical protein
MKPKKHYHSRNLSELLHDLVTDGNSYIDAMVEIQDLTKIEFEELIELLPDVQVKKIKKEFIKRHYHIKLNKTDSKLKKEMNNKSNDIIKLLKVKK